MTNRLLRIQSAPAVLRRLAARRSAKRRRTARPLTARPLAARRGAAVVEFAVLAPLLFLLIFGMIEYGRMIMVQQLITNASREGARVAILDGMTNAEVIDAVQEKVAGAVPLVDSDITTNPADITAAAGGESITVIVGVNFADVSWLPEALWLGGKRLTASSAMRRETVQ